MFTIYWKKQQQAQETLVHDDVCSVVDAQSSDAGTIGCRIPSRNIELLKNLTVLGT